jgi:hypothetical protein
MEQIDYRSLAVLKYLYDHPGWHVFVDVAKAVRCEDIAVIDAMNELRDGGFIEIKGGASKWTARGDLRARIQPSGVERVRDWEECLGKE